MDFFQRLGDQDPDRNKNRSCCREIEDHGGERPIAAVAEAVRDDERDR